MHLFEGSGGFGDGEQLRDFVYISDAVAVTLWFLEHSDRSGIFDVGTGVSASFNTIARLVAAHHGAGEVRYFPMPEDITGSYQHSTRAATEPLRRAGCMHPFRSVKSAVPLYLELLDGT